MAPTSSPKDAARRLIRGTLYGKLSVKNSANSLEACIEEIVQNLDANKLLVKE